MHFILDVLLSIEIRRGVIEKKVCQRPYLVVCDSDEESDEDDDLELNALEKRAKTAATQQQNGEVDEEDRKDLLPVRTKQGWVQRYLF